MITDLNIPVRMGKEKVKQATNTLSRAFRNDELYSYIIPDEVKRNSILPLIFEFRIRYGLSYGEVYASSSEVEGLAIWIPNKNIEMTLWRIAKCGGISLFLKAGKSTMKRLFDLAEYASEIHKKHANFPHWHLSPIGIDPIFQGKGYAGILLSSKLKKIDEEHLPCFLETQSEKNVLIYKRYGFKIVEEGKIPGTKLPHWAMLRDKR